jgi:hypothetical protein
MAKGEKASASFAVNYRQFSVCILGMLPYLMGES